MSVAASSVGDRKALAGAFVEVLSYPYSTPALAAWRCADAARGESSDAASLLEAFASLVEATEQGTLQEEYTRAFDLDTMSRSEPTCYPYVGHYLFDESHKRGAFILGLRKRFRAAGFEDDSDLSDHLVVLLRFLAVSDDEELVDELVDDAILPALARMAIAAGPTPAGAPATLRDAYLGVVRALALSLGAGRPERAVDPLTAETEREWARSGDSLGISRDWCGH